MSSVHVARQGFITKSALPSVSRPRGTTTVADNRTVLLLNGNGTNGAQNNTFVDASTNNFTITRNGNATQGSFSPFTLPDGQWSNYFDGNGDALVFGSSTGVANFTGAYTVEFFINLQSNLTYLNDNNYYSGYLLVAGGPSQTGGFEISVRSTNNSTTTPTILRLSTFGSPTPSALEATGLTFTIGQWYHIVAVRNSSNVTSMFINGTRVATATISGSYTGRNVDVGGNPDSTGYQDWFPGYISNMRVVKDTAVYDPTQTTLTVPTSPLTAITNTSLLTCQSNRFIDNSSNNFAITRNGDVRVTPWSPFAPTSAYDPATNGGSGYFDGNGDYVYSSTASSNFDYGTGAFTIEFWIYPTTPSTSSFTPTFFTQRGNGGWVDSGKGIRIHHNTAIFGALSFTTLTFSTPIPLNTWSHVAIVRSGNTITAYLNGVSNGSVTFTGSLGDSADLPALMTSDSVSSGGREWAAGYVSNFRIVKGTAVYTSAFTPPTAPVTNITNTSLLLNFTNAGIFDTAGNNVIETVGNAQIDTAVKKYGSGSLEFDGTGDYLFIPNDVNKTLGTGDYTIEFWVYANNWTSTPVLLEYGRPSAASTPGLEFYISNTSGKLDIYGGSAVATLLISAGTNISTGSWTHLALTRASGSTKLFLNGTQTGSTATDTTNYTQATAHIGSYFAGALCLNGYIDDFRITKGVARYTANFTPPTAELVVYGTTDNIVNNSTYGVYQLA